MCVINLTAVLDAARQVYLVIPGVVSVDEDENLLRIVVENEEVRDRIPKTFLHEEQGFEIGTEIKTVDEVEAFKKAKLEEKPVS